MSDFTDLVIPIGITFVVLQVLCEIYLDFRQLIRHKRKDLPENLKPLISEEEFFKAQDYTVAKAQFSIVGTLVSSVNLFLIVFICLYQKIWRLSAGLVEKFGFSPDNELLVSAVFVILNDIVGQLTDIPLKWYETFSIESKFGFNRKTPKIFITDTLKDFAVNAVLEIPLFTLVLYLIKAKIGGQYYWLIAFVIVGTFLIAIQQVMILYIMPLFNKFTKLEDEQFTAKIHDFAKQCDFPLGDVYEMDGSLRSNKANAYFAGLYGARRVVLYDTLLDYVRKDNLLEVDHILGVLGHEIGHCKNHHLWKTVGILLTQMFVLFYAFSLVIESPVIYTISGFKNSEQYIIVGIMGFMFLILPVLKFVNVVLNIFTRKFEYEADQYAVQRKMDLGTPLLILCTENLADFDPDPWYSFYHFSHPTLTDRLREMHYKPVEGIIAKREAAHRIKEEREAEAKRKKKEEQEALLKQLKEGKGKKGKEEEKTQNE